jgi:hypothetical protein
MKFPASQPVLTVGDCIYVAEDWNEPAAEQDRFSAVAGTGQLSPAAVFASADCLRHHHHQHGPAFRWLFEERHRDPEPQKTDGDPSVRTFQTLPVVELPVLWVQWMAADDSGLFQFLPCYRFQHSRSH